MPQPLPDGLRLSPYILPEVRVGNVVAGAQNLSDGADRLAYLEGAREFLSLAARHVGSPARMEEAWRSVPFAAQFLTQVMVDGRVEVRLSPNAADSVSFRGEGLRVLLKDGRRRRVEEMLAYETGEMTPEFGELISALMRGVETEALIAAAAHAGVELDAEQLETWLHQGVVESGSARSGGPGALGEGPGDSVTWLGHAAVIFHAPDATVWVDPYLQPKIEFRTTEVGDIFREEFAESRLFRRYGPGCDQWSMHGLPSPTAVLITHQDSDHFSLGELMALPLETTIVVPRVDPGRPWDLDLRAAIHRVLGERRKVVALGHGESARFGSVSVTAFPFVGEFPAALAHTWNCYLVETDRSVAVFAADAALTDAQVHWLSERLKPGRVCALFAREIYDAGDRGTAYRRGYIDAADHLYSDVRLWPWYAPPARLFEPSPVLGVSRANLRTLVRSAGVTQFFPYALGSTPWFRFTRKDNFFVAKIASMSRADLDAQVQAAQSTGATLPLLHYAVPSRLG